VITALPVLTRRDDAKRIEALIALESWRGSSDEPIRGASTVTLPEDIGETVAPRTDAISSMLRTSPISGTFVKETGFVLRRDAAIMGNASFLFPETLIVPLSLAAPSTIKQLMMKLLKRLKGKNRIWLECNWVLFY
jgi:hypothetical protein